MDGSFFFYDRFPDPDHRKRAERWSDLSGRSGRAGASFGNPFIFHMIGAGDIKLLCALGGIMGPRTVMECIVYSLLAGAGISLAIYFYRRYPPTIPLFISVYE